MTSNKTFPKGTIILFVSLIVLLVTIFIKLTPSKNTAPNELVAVLRPHSIPIQPFTLTTKNNQTFSNENLTGKWSFVFFGYTHCPDICPTTLLTLQQIHKTLKKQPERARDFQVIFVSVDPARDKLEKLVEYTAYFNKEFIAVTGYGENLDQFVRQFSAPYMKQETDIPGEYLISHTSSIFLVDPNMRIVASFSPPHDVETISSQYLKITDLF